MYPTVQRITVKWNGEEKVTYFFKGFEDPDDKVREAVRNLFYSIADELGHYSAEKQRVYLYVRKEDALDDSYEDERWDTYEMLSEFEFLESDWIMFRTYVKEETIMRYLHQHLSKFIELDEVDIDSLGMDAGWLKMEFDERREEEFAAWRIEREDKEW